MECCVTQVDNKSARETWSLHYLTDTHIDDPDHAKDEFKARIQLIKDDPKALWIGGGDYGSLILPGDRRFGSGGHIQGEWAEHLNRLPDFYLDGLVEHFSPIKDKCLGLVAGNHESTISKNYHRGVVAELAVQLDRPELYLGDRGWVVVRFKGSTKEVPLRVYAFHGWQTGRLPGGPALGAQRVAGQYAADVIFFGHNHQPGSWVFARQKLTSNNHGYQLRNEPVVVMNGGSWTYGQTPPTKAREKIGWKPSNMPAQTWAEGKNFAPQPLVNPYIDIHVDMGLGKRASRPLVNGRGAGFDFEPRGITSTKGWEL